MINNEISKIHPILEEAVKEFPKKERLSYALFPLYEAEVVRDVFEVGIFGENHLSLDKYKRNYGERSYNKNKKPSKLMKTERYTIEAIVDKDELMGAVDVHKALILKQEERLELGYEGLMNSLEYEQMKQVCNKEAFETLGHFTEPEAAQKWDHKDSNPIEHIAYAKQTIKSKIGFYPNTVIISDPVWQKLRYKKNLLDAVPFTQVRAGLTPEDFAHIIEVERVIIADSMIQTEGNMEFIWSQDVILAYVPKQLISLDKPSFGVTIRCPLTNENFRQWTDESSSTQITAIDEYIAWGVCNYEAGFFFKNVIG